MAVVDDRWHPGPNASVYLEAMRLMWPQRIRRSSRSPSPGGPRGATRSLFFSQHLAFGCRFFDIPGLSAFGQFLVGFWKTRFSTGVGKGQNPRDGLCGLRQGVSEKRPVTTLIPSCERSS